MSKVTTDAKFEALYIDPICLKKIDYWAEAASGEVSGLGTIIKEGEKMVVRDVYILDQACTGTDTELDPEAISKLMQDMITEEKDCGNLKFWWHSHVNMGVFWSGTDDACAETLSREYAFSLVVNKKKERKVRLDLYNPFRITVDNIKLIELSMEDEDLKKQCEEDVKSKVRTTHFTSYGGNYNNFGSYYNKNKSWRNGYYEDDLYDYGHGKKISLTDDEVEDVERLSDIIFSGGYTKDALEVYIKEMVMSEAGKMYEKDANCREGVGNCCDPKDGVCAECKVIDKCLVLSSKFGDFTTFEEDTEFMNNDCRNREIIIDVESDD